MKIPFPYISKTYGTKNYIYEKFFTPAARLLFYLIVYIIWRGTQVAIRGGPAKTVVRDNRSEGSNPSLAAKSREVQSAQRYLV